MAYHEQYFPIPRKPGRSLLALEPWSCWKSTGHFEIPCLAGCWTQSSASEQVNRHFCFNSHAAIPAPAEPLKRKFLEASGSPSVTTISLLLSSLGQKAESLAAAERACAIAKDLAEADPADSGLRSELARAKHLYGDSLQQAMDTARGWRHWSGRGPSRRIS